jgi:hypothetical protein
MKESGLEQRHELIECLVDERPDAGTVGVGCRALRYAVR